MDNIKGKLYERANKAQRHDAQQIIKEFSHCMQWRLDGNDSLMDVGTGSGDVLMDFLYPIMPRNFRKIIGIDISAEMVRHCKQTYSSQVDRVDFKILDIGTERLPEEFIDEFDHVTSSYTLQWLQNQRRAMENIYQMLHSEGDCLLLFLESHVFVDIYKVIARNPKWAHHVKDVNSFMSTLFCSKDSEAEFRQIIKDVGFVDYTVEVRSKTFVYEGVNVLRENARAVNPYIHLLPMELREEYLDELVNNVIARNLYEPIADDLRFIIPYNLMVAYARK